MTAAAKAPAATTGAATLPAADAAVAEVEAKGLTELELGSASRTNG